jgi:large subunit ribosomal protein L15
MTVLKRKKSTRQHATTTHGWGSRKKHRGAGSRGGRGNAGRGKRSDHKKQSYTSRGIFLGRTGFTSHSRTKKQSAINVGTLQEHIDNFTKTGKIEKKGDIYIINAKKVGYGSILGSGTLRVKLEVTAPHVSKKAEEKITAAGGKVIKPEADTSK